MGKVTGIEWTATYNPDGTITPGATWNPWRGCHKVSPACAHCYMFREQTRYGNDPNVVVRAGLKTFNAPLDWKDPLRIFVCSWSDFFIEEADPWRPHVWNIIKVTPEHTYLILTKRPERFEGNLPWYRTVPLNCWLGVSVENVRFYQRIYELQKISAPVRFLSIEPLLGPMPDLPLDGIGWVIVGGESGPGWRPLNLDWVRQIRDRCVERGVPFFFKQFSGFQPKSLGRELDGREWNEIPSVGGSTVERGIVAPATPVQLRPDTPKL